MTLNKNKLFADSFRLFTEKRWEKLIEIIFCKFSLIQHKLILMINALSFSPNLKCLLWKNWSFMIVKCVKKELNPLHKQNVKI